MLYKRSFQLSDAIDVENISARTQDGVLTVTLPKSERAKVHRITVEYSNRPFLSRRGPPARTAPGFYFRRIFDSALEICKTAGILPSRRQQAAADPSGPEESPDSAEQGVP